MAKRIKKRKEKKINPYAPLLLVVVIAISAMGIIPILLDDTNADAFAAIQTAIETEYLKLSELVKELSKEVKNLKENVDDLKGVDITNKDWEDASEHIENKLVEIAEFEKKYLDSFTNVDLGLTYLDYFKYYDEKTGELVSDTFAVLKREADIAANRATSLKALNQVVTNYKKDVQAVLTNVEFLEKKLAEIDKDKKFDLKDLDTFTYVKAHFATIHPSIYTPEDYAALNTKINRTMNDDIKAQALADFVAKASVLPSNPYKFYDIKSLETVKKALDLLTDSKHSLFTAQELVDLGPTSEYAKKLAIYDACDARSVYVAEITGDKKTPNTAEFINEQLKGKNTKTINQSNYESVLNDIHNIEAMILQWEIDYGIETDKNQPNYCDQIYNLIDRDILRAYIANYNKFINSR